MTNHTLSSESAKAGATRSLLAFLPLMHDNIFTSSGKLVLARPLSFGISSFSTSLSDMESGLLIPTAILQASVLTIDTRSKSRFFIQEVRHVRPTAHVQPLRYPL